MDTKDLEVRTSRSGNISYWKDGASVAEVEYNYFHHSNYFYHSNNIKTLKNALMEEGISSKEANAIAKYFTNIIDVIGKIFLLILAISAFKGKTVKLPLIDNMINKHLS